MTSSALAQAREAVEDVDQLWSLFLEAGETERRLPSALAALRDRGSWPATVPDRVAYGYNEVEVRPGPATAKAIKRYDLVLALYPLMEADDARLVQAAVATAAFRRRGPNWARVARHARMHAQTVKRRVQDAMVRLWYRIVLEGS